MSNSEPTDPGPQIIVLAAGLNACSAVVRQALDVVAPEHRQRLAAAGINVHLHRATADAVLDLVQRRIGRLAPESVTTLHTAFADTEHAYIAALRAIVISCKPSERADLAFAVWHEVGHALLADGITARGAELHALVALSPSWIQRRLSAYENERQAQELMAWLYAVATAYRWQLPAWIHPELRRTLIDLLR